VTTSRTYDPTFDKITPGIALEVESVKSQMLKKFLILTGALIVTGCGLEGRSSHLDNSTGKRLQFRIILLCDYGDEEATKAGFRTVPFSTTHLGCTQFEASDGEELFTYGGEFRSPEEAKRYLDWKVARSSKILAQGTKTDPKGKSVGARAEVLLPPDQKESAVMWTNGPMFREIIAKSLADAVELEKRYGY
jgi:hypothetical protein